jgi:hypothetical protein
MSPAVPVTVKREESPHPGHHGRHPLHQFHAIQLILEPEQNANNKSFVVPASADYRV